MKIQRLNLNSKDYPDKLKLLRTPPEQISFLGKDLNTQLSTPTLGIVGSRKVSQYGRVVTERFSELLARREVCIVSGLALGVDAIAHRGALEVKGKTIAVMPGGLSSIYPATNRQLAKNILASGGTLISEYVDDFRPRRESFIQRNRIIAALSDALLVTEAAEKSGSLHTAKFALELGKPVLAVPGSINSPNNAGTNNLLKSGAIMVTEEQDIFTALGLDLKNNEKAAIYGDNDEETVIINLLSSGISYGDELAIRSKMEIDLFQQTLTMLEIKGVIVALGNNNWKLKNY